MKVLFDINLTTIIDNEKWKSLKILFNLRNQLAHGRTTKFMTFWDSYGKFKGVSIEGSSYKQPLEYLINKNIIEIKKGETPNESTFLWRIQF